MSFNAGAASAHIGGALSCADIISVIFSNFLNFKKGNPLWRKEIVLF